MFRLTHFYEYKFPANLTNPEMNLEDVVVPQQGLHECDYYLQSTRLQSTFSDDLKKLLESTTNISNAQAIPTPQNIKEIFVSDKKNKYFQ